MSNYIEVQRAELVRDCLNRGLSHRRTAALAGVSRRTVDRYALLMRDGVDIAELDAYVVVDEYGSIERVH